VLGDAIVLNDLKEAEAAGSFLRALGGVMVLEGSDSTHRLTAFSRQEQSDVGMLIERVPPRGEVRNALGDQRRDPQRVVAVYTPGEADESP
jgi:hypothetical protein